MCMRKKRDQQGSGEELAGDRQLLMLKEPREAISKEVQVPQGTYVMGYFKPSGRRVMIYP